MLTPSWTVHGGEVCDFTSAGSNRITFFEYCNLWNYQTSMKLTESVEVVVTGKEEGDIICDMKTDRWSLWRNLSFFPAIYNLFVVCQCFKNRFQKVASKHLPSWSLQVGLLRTVPANDLQTFEGMRAGLHFYYFMKTKIVISLKRTYSFEISGRGCCELGGRKAIPDCQPWLK